MILDIINKKRLGKELSYSELDYFFNGYLDGKIADYQMSSLLMAICWVCWILRSCEERC